MRSDIAASQHFRFRPPRGPTSRDRKDRIEPQPECQTPVIARGPLSLLTNSDAPDIVFFTSAAGASRRKSANQSFRCGSSLTSQKHRVQTTVGAQMPRYFHEPCRRPDFFRKQTKGMEHHIPAVIVRRRPCPELRARNLLLRHTQPEHSRRQMLRRVNGPFDAQNLLRARNSVRVKEAMAMMSETPSECSGAGLRTSSSCLRKSP